MKTQKIIAALVMGMMLSLTPAMAQGRGGGSHGGGSGSRGGGGVSHSSSSMGSRSSSSMSHSSSSMSRSSSSVSRPSTSVSHSSSSMSRPSTSVSRPSSNSVSRPTPSGNVSRPTPSSRPSGNVSRPSTSSRPSVERGGSVSRPSNTPASVTRGGTTTGRGGSPNVGGDAHRQGPNPGVNGQRPGNPNHGGYDRPGHVGHPGHPGAPHAHHPVHPVFYHPYHHHMMHMHCVYWDPCPHRYVYWPGFWVYCNDYWYDYHTTNYIVVRDHARNSYGIDLVSYAISGDLMYALVNETDGNTYLQVYDNQDKLLAEQKVNRKYIKCEIDRENGGCWIFKKGDKDPLLFIFTDGQFLIYEAD